MVKLTREQLARIRSSRKKEIEGAYICAGCIAGMIILITLALIFN